jgi:uncharacterized membrane protein
MKNQIEVKAYLFLILMFCLGFGLSILSYLTSATILTVTLIIATVVFSVLLILYKPERKIKIILSEKHAIYLG